MEVNNEVATEEVVKVNNENNISLDDVKNAIESNLEVKGYIDSLIDKTVSNRLEKRLKKELEKKAKEEEEFKKLQLEKDKMKEYENKISQLELEIKYSKVLENSGLPSDCLKFLARENTTLEELQENIKIFQSLIEIESRKLLSKKWIDNPIPSNSDGKYENNKLW